MSEVPLYLDNEQRVLDMTAHIVALCVTDPLEDAPWGRLGERPETERERSEVVQILLQRSEYQAL
jgi:hypothetical protein